MTQLQPLVVTKPGHINLCPCVQYHPQTIPSSLTLTNQGMGVGDWGWGVGFHERGHSTTNYGPRGMGGIKDNPHSKLHLILPLPPKTEVITPHISVKTAATPNFNNFNQSPLYFAHPLRHNPLLLLHTPLLSQSVKLVPA